MVHISLPSEEWLLCALKRGADQVKKKIKILCSVMVYLAHTDTCVPRDVINGGEGDGDLQTAAVVVVWKETVLAALGFG